MSLEGVQTLLIDADDTLWENNIYFEQAWEDFERFLAHSTLRGSALRDFFDAIEIENIRVNGYGAKNFGKNLVTCFERLAEREVSPADVEVIRGLAHRILDQSIEMLPGVEETLDYLLHRNHDLILFTKGQEEEQRLKIDRSPVGRYFRHFEVVPEKHVAAYAQFVERFRLNPETTWMIGNSPKSDINPALGAGLNAVFVPHERTWSLERMELASPGPGALVVVEKFSDLQNFF
jgi:putative hydrolase of the HAD superfamily